LHAFDCVKLYNVFLSTTTALEYADQLEPSIAFHKLV